MKRKYIHAIFFIAIIVTFCGTATAADTNPATVNDQVTASSVQDTPIDETSSTSTQDTQSDTNSQTTVNDQATTSSEQDNSVVDTSSTSTQDTQSDTNPQTTQNVVSNDINTANEDPIVITFDDGFESTYSIAYPLMQQYGIKGTVYVVPSWIGSPGYLTLAELTILHNAGWTIASHSWDHTVLTSLTTDQITAELQSTMEWLNDNGFADGAYYLAYPYGQYNDNVLQVVTALGIKTARTVDWGTITPDGYVYPYGTPLNYLELPVILVRSDTLQSDWQSELDRSIAREGTAIFLLHDIKTGTPTILEDITASTFTTIIEYIHQTGVKTLTNSQWYNSNFDKVAPTASANPTTGSYNTNKIVTLSMSEDGSIYYTTDGSAPTTGSTKYTTTIPITSTTILKFLAEDLAGNLSPIYTETYTIDKVAPTASANPTTGSYNTDKIVTLSMSEDGSIYYTTDGSAPTTGSTKYTTTIPITSTTILKFLAEDLAGNLSPIYTETYTIDKVAPTASANPTTGLYNTDKIVTLSMDKDGSIYYTTDGSAPTTSSTKYTTTIPITSTTILKFLAEDLAGNLSPIYTETYTIDKVAPKVSNNLQSGLYNTNKFVTLSMNEPGSIYYSRNGGTPSALYTGPISISWTCNLKYFAKDTANNPSPIYSKTYSIDKVAPKVSDNLQSGLYNTNKFVTLSMNEPGSIYYSRIGGTPRVLYTGPISISWTCNLKYFAKDTANNPSPIYSKTYSIDKVAPKVSDNLQSGLYNTNKFVTLSMNEPGSIYYSRIGGTPRVLYTGPISISWTCNLKYFAKDTANNPSPIYSKTYFIDKVAPKVSKTSPTNRKTGISRTGYIYIKFSENIKKSTYWSKIRIKNLKTGKYISISKYLSGSLLKIKTSKKSAHRWYQVIIPLAAIQDNAGNKLKTTYTFKFKTRG